jgi:hypothetical protein
MEKKIFEAFIDKGYTQRQIGKDLKLSHTAVRYWLKKFKLKTNGKPKEKAKIINGCKICTECKENKTVKEFYLRTDKKNYASKCKKCANKYYGNRIKDVKIKMIEYKGGECERCELKLKDSHYSVFDFHHLDPKTKDVKFDKIKFRKWEKIKSEIDKCALLCSNCHRITHSEIGGY